MTRGAALPDLLSAVAAELTRLHERALDLQSATGALAEGGAARAVEALQDLDRLTQDLSGLSAYAAALSAQGEAAWRVDEAAALEAVTLASLARRLSPGSACAGDDCGGDVELFGPT